MPPEARLASSLAIAVGLVYLTTPLAIRLAGRLEFFDRPAGYKGHASPTPYLGGAAVMGVFVLVAAVLAGSYGRTLPLIGGVVVLWAVGTIDDRRSLAPTTRVLVEIALGAGLWSLGHGWDLGLGSGTGLMLTVIWVVGLVNAFNLFDNMDGAAPTMAAIVAIGLAVLGAFEDDLWLSAVSLALAGACLGFLPFNLSSPARIFLGDGGSMPLGFAVATLVMMGTQGALPAWQGLAAALLLVGVPALDTALVVISRRRRGVSVLTGGRDHLTHRTAARVRHARAVALTLGAFQALLCLLAVVASRGGSGPLVVAVGLYLVAAGSTIAVLDRAGAPAGVAAIPPEGGRAWPRAALLLVPLGLALSLSPLFEGYYDSAIWVPAGLVLGALMSAAVIARPMRLPTAAVLTLGAVVGLAALSVLSGSWAESSPQAIVEGNRWLVYAALLGLLLAVVRTPRAALWLGAALAAGVAGFAMVLVARALGSDPSNLFLVGRLDEPLGYINGEACYLVIGTWVLVAVAEQRRAPLLAGAALSLAVVCVSLALLSQSRGAVLAAVVSAIVLVAVVPGRERRLAALGLIAAAVGVSAPGLLDVYSDAGGGPVDDEIVRTGVRMALIAAAIAGVVWSAAVAWVNSLDTARLERARRTTGRALVVAGVAVLALGAANSGRIANTVETNARAFVHLGEPVGSSTGIAPSRLASGAGNRYDYWRVAWHAFTERPAGGTGAGNYDVVYFRERSTPEDVRQPHSLQLQALGEMGVGGGLLVLALLAGIASLILRARASAATSGTSRVLLVAGAGATVTWAAHTSVDWMHLLPGLTGLAMAGIALVVAASPSRPSPDPAPDSRTAVHPGRRIAWSVGLSLVVVVGAFSLGRQGLTEHYVRSAQGVLAERPADALERADRALRLDSGSIQAYYVKAAALARYDEGAAAENVLRTAAGREPSDFLTWALLGDLAVRRGNIQQAGRYYSRAHELNPREPALAELARDPRQGGDAQP